MYEQTDFSMPGTSDHNAPDSPESLLIGGPVQECRERALGKPGELCQRQPEHPAVFDVPRHGGQHRPLRPKRRTVCALKAEGADAAYYPMEDAFTLLIFLPEAEPIIL